MKEYYYGIYGIQFIWHGEWADPELVWHGKSFNYYEIDDPLYADWSEDVRNGETTLYFDAWVKKHAHLVREYLQNLLDAKCFYGGQKK
jgi:hypothetical protein